MTATMTLPTPELCPAWCTNEKHVGADLVWDDFYLAADRPDGEGSRTCTHVLGTVNEPDGHRLVTAGLQRHQFFDHVTDPVTVQLGQVNIAMSNDMGFGLDFTREQTSELQQLLNAGNIMLAEPDLPLRHFGWCLFPDDGPDAEDCGPNDRDCTSEHHRIPAIQQRTFCGPDGTEDGGALNVRLTNEPEYGPTIALDDQIGSRDSQFPAWFLHPDEAETLAHYLLALVGRAHRGGGVR